MLAPISHGRRDKGTSFKTLKDYLLKERDPETGEQVFRVGNPKDDIITNELLSLETAHAEMRAVALNNPLVKDPIYHYQLAWQPGEKPTREQWQAAARKTIADLGFADHQYLCVPHDDKAHFHVHVMLNRVHPESYRAHYPMRDMLTLDKAIREIENDQGWKESVGHYRWDAEAGCAVKTTREERDRLATETLHAKGKAAEVEHYRDIESLQTYVRNAPAKELKAILSRGNPSWQDVHAMLAAHGLELDKSEHGGYTVKVIDGDLRVKASDVFRAAFAGKENRRATEEKLGVWQEPEEGTRQRTSAAGYRERPRRDPEKREKQREEREKQRRELKAEFAAYRSAGRARQKQHTASIGEQRKALHADLKAKKRAIRARADLSWPEKRAELSRAVAESVVQQRLLRVQALRERLEIQPKTYQQWVGERAQTGDKRAAAQLRGWRYQDQRVANKTEDLISKQGDAAHLGAPEGSDASEWSELTNDRLKELQRNEELAKTIAATRWTINRRSGDVTYTVRGVKAIVDRGRVLSVLNNDEAAILLGLEMAVKKYGPVITATGSDAWKQKVAKVAAKNGVFIQFADPKMQQWMEQEQSRSNVLGTYADKLAELHTRVVADPLAEIALMTRDAANTFVSAAFGLTRARGYVDDLQKAMEPDSERHGNVRGVFSLFIRRSADGNTWAYSVRALPGKGQELIAMLKTAADQARLRADQDQKRHQKPTGDKAKERQREREGKSRG